LQEKYAQILSKFLARIVKRTWTASGVSTLDDPICTQSWVETEARKLFALVANLAAQEQTMIAATDVQVKNAMIWKYPKINHTLL